METTYTDVSHENQYKDQIGVQYRVVDTLFAYGVRKHSKANVTHVVLEPPPGFAGPEVGFKRQVPLGTVLIVQKIFMSNRWLDPPLSFEIKFLNYDLGVDVPVRVDLMLGNELRGTNNLSPKIYQKLGVFKDEVQQR